MELRHLRYFSAVAEELHFTRAAARIGIAQPALTQQVKSLEQELGVRLFDRLPGQVRLTEPGRVLFEEARTILDSVARATVRCRLSNAGMIGRVGVGFTESASFHAEVTSCLHRFRDLHPQVEVTLEEARSTQLMQSLRQGRIDVAFVRLPIGMDEDIRFRLLAVEPMVVAVPRTHRFAKRRSLRLRDLEGEVFVLYPRATRYGLSDAIVTACEAMGFSPKVIQTAPQISSTINLVASALGVTIVPACMRSARAQEVSYVALSDGGLEASLGIAWRNEQSSPTIENLLALVGDGLPSRRAATTRRARKGSR